MIDVWSQGKPPFCVALWHGAWRREWSVNHYPRVSPRGFATPVLLDANGGWVYVRGSWTHGADWFSL